jgi:ssDNA-binding Zn-finger/Zn-ribbon topoisomerase 1
MALCLDVKRCNLPMVRRIQKATGQLFFGCSQFPKCRFTKYVIGYGAKNQQEPEARFGTGGSDRAWSKTPLREQQKTR